MKAKIPPLRVSPHLSPRRGHPLNEIPPVFTCVLSGYCRLTASPTSVGFNGSRGLYILVAALAENLPHRSRENEFSAGRFLTVKDKCVLFTSVTRVGRVGAGAISAPSPETNCARVAHWFGRVQRVPAIAGAARGTHFLASRSPLTFISETGKSRGGRFLKCGVRTSKSKI